jgi:hypothetical protein
MRLIQRHARGGRRKRAPPIEPTGIEDLVARLRSGLDHRIAVLDVGQRSHPVEQRPLVRVHDRIAAKLDERGMDVIRRDRGADPV